MNKVKKLYHTLKSKHNKRFVKDMKAYSALCKDSELFQIKKKYCFPIYNDSEEAASIDEHYFLQDIYFSHMINENCKNKINMHYDIGSRIDGFIAQLLSAGTKVTMLDIRPLSIKIPGLDFIHTDATMLDEITDGSIESISSLHAIEHFGLGRYGDHIDPNAWEKALRLIQRKIKGGGDFLLICSGWI